MPNIADDQSHLSMDALENAIRAADASALLVPAWLLQKLMAYDRGPGANVFSLPRAQAHLIARDRLLEIAQREELPLDTPPPAQTLLLLARPEADQLASTSSSEMLLRYWRLMFNARIKNAMQACLTGAPIPRVAVQERIERLGRGAFSEARYVLLRERYLLGSADDQEAYAEFAALYLEITSFAPAVVTSFFPAIEDATAVRKLLAADVDWESILKSTRPSGAADPQTPTAEPTGPTSSASKSKRRVGRDASHRERLLAKAVAADAVRNDVRAAIFRMRVYRAASVPGPTRDSATTIYADALKDLDQLTARLKAALQLDDSLARQWRAWLVALLENAAGGWWNAEGRLLYDLQKVCVYHEREIYSVSVVDYLVNFARRPLRRPQPGQRLVLTLKSLRSALRRTARARLSSNGRAELQRLLRTAIHDAETRLRDFMRPGIASALDTGGLHPAGATESVAHAKLTEELLDEISDNGYLTFPALRDVVSRNQMKLNDLKRPGDFVHGDQLLRIDRSVEDKLDYVYHRGEIYLRGFHRLSSIFFATAVGRIITKFIILPLGGAFITLEALDHSVGLLIHKLSGHAAVATPGSADEKYSPIFFQVWLLIALSFFLFGLINLPPFRAAVAAGFRYFFRALKVILIDVPRSIANLPWVQAIFKSQFARLFGRYIIKPLAIAGIAYVLVPHAASQKIHMLTLAAVFVAVNLLLNSRAGRAIEQAVLHTLRTTFARFTWEILVAMIRGIMQIFQSLLEAVDRVLYAVDELLRFRAGQKKTTIVVKAVLGVFWFFIAYFTRFVINLLVEPQINPIKHFPVVTVSHKMILPTTLPLAHLLEHVKFAGVSIEFSRALAIASLITLCTPGIFGFLAWEFRENWKLYKANRSKNLKPIRIGSHGETLATFLRPGFHSGTIPKIFHRMRKLQLRTGAPLPSDNKHLHAAHHVEHSLADFFNREFIALLNRHPLFHQTPISLGHIHLAATQIRIEFQLANPRATSSVPLTLSFEQRAGWIMAGVDQRGWSGELSDAPARQLAGALLGLYKLSGVDIVREHVRSLFAPHEARFDFRRNDLIVWPTADFSIEAVYDLSGTGPLVPRFTTAPQDARLPTLSAEQILFRGAPVARNGWIQLWESPQAAAPFPAMQVMPPAADTAPPNQAVAPLSS